MSETLKISHYLAISGIILIAGFAVGFGLSITEPAFGETLLTLFQEMIAGQIMGDDPPMLALQLFLNNLEACVVIFIGGAFFGFLSVFILMMNGVIIGAVLEIVRKEAGYIALIAAIVPHGIFELPAVIASGALGLMLGRAVKNELAGGSEASIEAWSLGGYFLKYIIPFVAIAAIIEAFITPAVLQMVT
ncbi:stage II sporulation protein M [Methanospirillum sp.]